MILNISQSNKTSLKDVFVEPILCNLPENNIEEEADIEYFETDKIIDSNKKSEEVIKNYLNNIGIETFVSNNREDILGMKEEKIDLLTVVSRNKGFFEKLFSPSFTKKILTQHNVPLFVFHE